MDNASKSLIIAGAILIVVMLISLGVLVFNRTTVVVDDNMKNIDNLSIQTFNAQFSQYLGDDVSGVTVLTLGGIAQANGVSMVYQDKNGNAITAGSVSRSKKYSVTATYTSKKISSITCKAKT